MTIRRGMFFARSVSGTALGAICALQNAGSSVVILPHCLLDRPAQRVAQGSLTHAGDG